MLTADMLFRIVEALFIVLASDIFLLYSLLARLEFISISTYKRKNNLYLVNRRAVLGYYSNKKVKKIIGGIRGVTDEARGTSLLYAH